VENTDTLNIFYWVYHGMNNKDIYIYNVYVYIYIFIIGCTWDIYIYIMYGQRDDVRWYLGVSEDGGIHTT
jgi:hypothetical protein